MSRRLPTPLIAAILIATSACTSGSTETPPRAIGNYCPLTDFITFSAPRAGVPETAANAVDTAETVRQIERHNSKRACVCENDCPGTPADPGR